MYLLFNEIFIIMKNIKAIELIKPAFGLDKGSVLSRLAPNELFTYSNETVGDNYNSKTSVSVSESVLSHDIARAIDWFKNKRSAKHVIQEQEEEIRALTDYIVNLERKMINDESQVKEKYDKLLNRINTKQEEFEKKLAELEEELENDIIAGETIGWADEAMTVYYNLIDLLKKLSA